MRSRTNRLLSSVLAAVTFLLLFMAAMCSGSPGTDHRYDCKPALVWRVGWNAPALQLDEVSTTVLPPS